MNGFCKFAMKNHLLIFTALMALSLLLWNIDRWVPVCPWGAIPGIIGAVFEVYVLIFRKKK